MSDDEDWTNFDANAEMTEFNVDESEYRPVPRVKGTGRGRGRPPLEKESVQWSRVIHID